MKSIFVTGGTGNVGLPIVHELVNRGYEAVVLTRTGVPNAKGSRPVFGSLTDLGRALPELSRCDGIIHLASERNNNRETVLTREIGSMGRLLDTWQKGNFVYASSQTVYGIPSGELTESSKIAPMCWYDLAKVSNEFQMHFTEPAFARKAAVGLRMALLFGSGPRCTDRQFLPLIYDQIRNGSAFLLDSEEGLETYGTSFIGEQDLARAFVDALDISVAGPYNIAGGFCTWKQLIEGFDRNLGTRSKFIVRGDTSPRAGEFRLPQSRSYLVTSAFENQTVFMARQSLDELLSKFVNRMQQLAAVRSL